MYICIYVYIYIYIYIYMYAAVGGRGKNTRSDITGQHIQQQQEAWDTIGCLLSLCAAVRGRGYKIYDLFNKTTESTTITTSLGHNELLAFIVCWFMGGANTVMR